MVQDGLFRVWVVSKNLQTELLAITTEVSSRDNNLHLNRPAMPPRLPILSALRASVRSINSRAFSSTAAVALPPREAPSAHPHHPTSTQQPSSTSSLLSLNRPNRRAGPKDRGAGVSVAEKMVSRAKERAEADLQAQQANQDLRREEQLSKAYLREMPRFWKVGDVYSPHDLSPVEMQKWRRRAERRGDIIDALGINPLDMYKVGHISPSSFHCLEGVLDLT